MEFNDELVLVVDLFGKHIISSKVDIFDFRFAAVDETLTVGVAFNVDPKPPFLITGFCATGGPGRLTALYLE